MMGILPVGSSFTKYVIAAKIVKNLCTKKYSHIYFLGAWAFQSTLTADEDPQFLSLPLPCETEPRLLFAGEATHGQFLGNLLGARFVRWLQNTTQNIYRSALKLEKKKVQFQICVFGWLQDNLKG